MKHRSAPYERNPNDLRKTLEKINLPENRLPRQSRLDGNSAPNRQNIIADNNEYMNPIAQFQQRMPKNVLAGRSMGVRGRAD
jgi:hypothetical protein